MRVNHKELRGRRSTLHLGRSPLVDLCPRGTTYRPTILDIVYTTRMLNSSLELNTLLEALDDLDARLVEVLNEYKPITRVREIDEDGEPVDSNVVWAGWMHNWIAWEEYESGQTELQEHERLSLELRGVIPSIRKTVASLWRVRQLSPKRFENDILDLCHCLRDNSIRSLFDIDEVAAWLLSLVTSISGEDGHVEPAAGTGHPSLTEFSEELMIALANNPGLLHTTRPFVFERVVAKIFERFDMRVHLTPQTRDGGYDIVALEESRFTKSQYLIEVKRFAPTKKVGLALVQRLYGVKTASRATKAFLVTTSSFSKPARDFAKQHCWELDLVDHKNLTDWLRCYWGKTT